MWDTNGTDSVAVDDCFNTFVNKFSIPTRSPTHLAQPIFKPGGNVNKPHIDAVGDSGASGHFFKKQAKDFLEYLRPTTGHDRVRVTTANNQHMYSTHVGYLPHPWLPPAARRAFIFDDVAANLFSYAQVVKHGCTVLLEQRGVTITDAATNEVLDFQARGADDTVFRHSWTTQDKRRRYQDRMQQMHNSSAVGSGSSPPHSAYTLIHNLPAVERARLYTEILCSMPTSTIRTAERMGWLATFPGLTKGLLKNLPYHSVAQAAGHMNRHRKNRASTKPKNGADAGRATPDDHDDDDDAADDDIIDVAFVTKEALRSHAETMFIDEPATLRDLDKSALSDTLIVVFNGYIRPESMKNGTGPEMVRAFESAVEHFRSKRKKVSETVLDNKCPQTLLDAFKRLGIKHQLIAPHVKRNNHAERAIQTFKNAFISAAVTAGPTFTMRRHAREVTAHIEIVLNVLRPCGTDKTKCAYEELHGEPYDFNSYPLLPIGTPVTVYDPPRTGQRGPWSVHGQLGRYVGPAPDHYRCWKICMDSTNKIRVTSTLDCHPKDILMRGASHAELVTGALTELTTVLRGANEKDLAGLDLTERHKHDLRQLHAVLTKRSPVTKAESDTERDTPTDTPIPQAAPTVAAQSPQTARTSAVPAAALSAPGAPQRVTGIFEGAAQRPPPQLPGTPPTGSPWTHVLPRVPGRAPGTHEPAQEARQAPPARTIESTDDGSPRAITDKELRQAKARTRRHNLEATTASAKRQAREEAQKAGRPPSSLGEETLSSAISRQHWPRGQNPALPPTTPTRQGVTTRRQSATSGVASPDPVYDKSPTPPPTAPSGARPRKTVHWTRDTPDSTPDKAAPAAAPVVPHVGKPDRRTARAIQHRNRNAANMAESAAFDATAAAADAKLRDAADRSDLEARQMRAEGHKEQCDRLHVACHNALSKRVRAEFAADIRINNNPHPCNPLHGATRRQAYEDKQAAIEQASHIAALLRPAIDCGAYDDDGDRTDLRELYPDDTPQQDGIAFGTVDDATGQAINLRQESKPGHAKAPGWCQARIEELQRLLVTTDCIEAMRVSERPRDGAIVSYVAWAASYKYDGDMNPIYRIRGAFGGNLLKNQYVGKTAAETASLPAFKILLNAVLSTRGAKFMTIDLKDMYLQSTLEQEEYVAIPVSEIPDASMERHNLRDKVRNGKVYFRVKKAMYGLPQAGYIAQQDLGKLLKANGFYECPRTPQVFRHETRNLTMSIVVDDFGVLYLKKEDVDWLLGVLGTKYELKVDWAGELYIGITLQWDYEARTCRMSMPDYIRKGVSRFLGESAATTLRHSPAEYKHFAYGNQTAPEQDDTAPLSKDRIKRVQAIVGYFLYYARAVDPTMLVALGQIASSQTRATEKVEAACTHFLQYAATYPNATIVYRSSDMVLRIVTDASFFSEPDPNGMGTRMGGVHMLGDKDDETRLNGMIETLCKLIDVVPASVAEAELASQFYNMKMAAETRLTLEDFGFPQPPTPVECDNQCAVGIANRDVKQKRSRAMDVRFHWVADRVKQGQFVITWKKGSQNLADYFTKIHPPKHHRATRSNFVCDKPLTGRTTSEMRRKKAPRNLTQQVANFVKYSYNII